METFSGVAVGIVSLEWKLASPEIPDNGRHEFLTIRGFTRVSDAAFLVEWGHDGAERGGIHV